MFILKNGKFSWTEYIVNGEVLERVNEIGNDNIDGLVPLNSYCYAKGKSTGLN